MSFYRWDGEDLLLDCHLQPKASRDEFAGQHGELVAAR
ncbi:YggU family protein, partial [Pseudomonas aeruginosa]